MIDALLDKELAERRERYKWLDGRYRWSAAGTLAIVYFMFINAVPVSTFLPSPAWLVVYLMAWSVAALFALLSLGKVATGMLAFVLWSKRFREKMGCTSLLWDDNVLACEGAPGFVSDFLALNEQQVREAKAQEIWRLAFLNRGRERDLMWSRLDTALLGIVAVLYAMAILIVSGHIKFPWP